MGALQEAFLRDHRVLTRGLTEVVELVEEDRFREAATRAWELDAAAGAHIEFEEARFYPEVEKARGAAYVDTLYDEHQSGVEAIRALEELDTSDAVDPEQKELILKHLRRALQHAVSCGTLLSHVTAMSEEDQRDLLDALEGFRENGRRWTQLERRRR
ncbi:MAG TPA: hemerythrin domain-containing protein [Vicinamibacteria bacterium]|nr:hemerythrin domain-containing protein [Vicinamibacteria bacterium]